MTQEEKELLIKDICARLPYGIFIYRLNDRTLHMFMLNAADNMDMFSHFLEYSENDDFKPYLRPMSSMTEEEMQDAREKFFNGSDHYDIDDMGEIYADTYQPYTSIYTLSFARLSGYIDWLNSHHFDYRRLIEMGLALKAPEGMYN